MFEKVPVGNTPDKWGIIRHNYRMLGIEMEVTGTLEIQDSEFIFPHHYTPIERTVWEELRLSRFKMFPQFPAGRYFLDFANPYLGVAIECDGHYHRTPEGRERDADRDANLNKDGWTVYRIDGSKCLRVVEDPIEYIQERYGAVDEYAESLVLDYLTVSSCGIVKLIKYVHEGCEGIDYLVSKGFNSVINEALSALTCSRRTAIASETLEIRLSPISIRKTDAALVREREIRHDAILEMLKQDEYSPGFYFPGGRAAAAEDAIKAARELAA